MLKVYRQLLDLLSARERRRLAILLAMILAMGFIDLAGVASIVPFLAVLSNPGIIQSNSYLAAANDMLGFTTANQSLVFLGLLTFGLVVFGQIFKALTVYALMRFSYLREFAIGSRMLASYLRQPYAWFLNRHSANLGMSVLSEVKQVVEGVLIPSLRVLAQGVVSFFLVGLLLVVQPVAAFATAIVVGGSYALIFVASRRYLARIGRDRLSANSERYRITQDSMRGIKDVKLLGLEDTYLDRFRIPAERYARFQATSVAIRELPRFLLEAIVFGSMTLFLLVLTIIGEGRLDEMLPVIGVYAFAGIRLFPAMHQMYVNVSRIRFNYATLEALHRDLHETQATAARADTQRSSAPVLLTERLELRDVHFAYDGAGRSALRGLDLTIDVNTTVGLVGTSGAGKTTAVDVILGLLEPQAGELVVDGTVIDSSNRRAWQRTLGYVPQQIFLTDDTVAANIAFGIPPQAIDMNAVERAARLAEIHDFVATELISGYETKIGEYGVRLSGGQRQRIGIARALYRDPSVLILDEATSSLDNLTERIVMDAVNNLGHRKTIIMIAHRLSTVRVCDQIFLLDQGRCCAFGSFDDLEKRNDLFRDMVLGGK